MVSLLSMCITAVEGAQLIAGRAQVCKTGWANGVHQDNTGDGDTCDGDSQVGGRLHYRFVHHRPVRSEWTGWIEWWILNGSPRASLALLSYSVLAPLVFLKRQRDRALKTTPQDPAHWNHALHDWGGGRQTRAVRSTLPRPAPRPQGGSL